MRSSKVLAGWCFVPATAWRTSRGRRRTLAVVIRVAALRVAARCVGRGRMDGPRNRAERAGVRCSEDRRAGSGGRHVGSRGRSSVGRHRGGRRVGIRRYGIRRGGSGGGAADAGLGALVAHEDAAKGQHGGMLVVRATAQAEVLDGGLAAARDGRDVIELQAPALRATLARRAHEGALIAVPRADGAPDGRRDVRRVGRLVARRPGARLRGTRARRRAELLLLELRDEHIERAVEQGREVTRRVLVAHEIASALQLVPRGSRDGQLHGETIRRERRHTPRLRRRDSPWRPRPA
jgi:hypothetical protein